MSQVHAAARDPTFVELQQQAHHERGTTTLAESTSGNGRLITASRSGFFAAVRVRPNAAGGAVASAVRVQNANVYVQGSRRRFTARHAVQNTEGGGDGLTVGTCRPQGARCTGVEEPSKETIGASDDALEVVAEPTSDTTNISRGATLAGVEGPASHAVSGQKNARGVIEEPKTDTTGRPRSNCSANKGASTPGMVAHCVPAPISFSQVEDWVSHGPFDCVLGPTETNEAEVFARLGAPLVDKVLAHGVGTIIAYGQTGSGKTHTINGLAARVAARLFAGLSVQPPGKPALSVCVTCVEILGARCVDLLHNLQPVKILEDGDGTVQLVGAARLAACDASALIAALERAGRQRSTAATGRHLVSSRSHAIYQISVWRPVEDTSHSVSNAKVRSNDTSLACARGSRLGPCRSPSKYLVGRLTLVDLAGSERAVDRCGNIATEDLQLSIAINKSLLAFKECIRANAAGAAIVPYRHSLLTLCLRDMFAFADSSSVFIACLSAHPDDSAQSRDTLKYAEAIVGMEQQRAQRDMPSHWAVSRVAKFVRMVASEAVHGAHGVVLDPDRAVASLRVPGDLLVRFSREDLKRRLGGFSQLASDLYKKVQMLEANALVSNERSAPQQRVADGYRDARSVSRQVVHTTSSAQMSGNFFANSEIQAVAPRLLRWLSPTSGSGIALSTDAGRTKSSQVACLSDLPANVREIAQQLDFIQEATSSARTALSKQGKTQRNVSKRRARILDDLRGQASDVLRQCAQKIAVLTPIVIQRPTEAMRILTRNKLMPLVKDRKQSLSSTVVRDVVLAHISSLQAMATELVACCPTEPVGMFAQAPKLCALECFDTLRRKLRNAPICDNVASTSSLRDGGEGVSLQKWASEVIVANEACVDALKQRQQLFQARREEAKALETDFCKLRAQTEQECQLAADHARNSVDGMLEVLVKWKTHEGGCSTAEWPPDAVELVDQFENAQQSWASFWGSQSTMRQ